MATPDVQRSLLSLSTEHGACTGTPLVQIAAEPVPYVDHTNPHTVRFALQHWQHWCCDACCSLYLQLAPVPQAASPQPTPAPVTAPTAGSKAGAVMKAVALVAHKAAGKFKGTAPSTLQPAPKLTTTTPVAGRRECTLIVYYFPEYEQVI